MYITIAAAVLPGLLMRRILTSAYLRHFAHRPAQLNPAWGLREDELAGVTIRWPLRYQWDAAGDWVDPLRDGFERYVPIAMAADIPQPYKGTVIFQMAVKGLVRNIAIGYSDYLPIDEECAANCDLYFKMQYDAAGYAVAHVVPGGYVADGKRLYSQLRRLRKLRDQRAYVTDVSGRFGLQYSREIREKATNMLRAQDRFKFEGGMNPISYSEFLREVSRSRIVIDMPGLGPFCFRLINYLAIGSCVIAYPHMASMHVPLVDGKHIIYCRSDMSDLLELCDHYLAADEEREAIATNAREYFDQNLHKDNLVRYYLRTCLDQLS
jgi:hypothetical protein